MLAMRRAGGEGDLPMMPHDPRSSLSPQRTEEVIFTKPNTLQFRCKSCSAVVTWSRYRTGGHSDCLIDRVNCQGRMMTARCPHCRQMYGKRLSRAQCVPNDALESALAEGGKA